MSHSGALVSSARLCAGILGLTLLVITGAMAGAPVTQQAHPARFPSSLDAFLDDHLPRIQGRVLGPGDAGFHVDVEGTFPAVTVQIVRKSVVHREGTRRVVTQNLGSGNLRSLGEGLGLLTVEPALEERIRSGDIVVWVVDPLYVRNESETSDDFLRSQLLERSRIRDVRFLKPSSGTPPDGSTLLELTDRQFRLKRVGEWGTMGTVPRAGVPGEDRSQTRAQRDRNPPLEIHRFNRVIHQFQGVSWPGNPRVRLLVLGGNHELGVARVEDRGLRNLAWNDLSGTVYDLSAVPMKTGGKPILPLVLAVNQDGRLQSRLYEYGLRARSLTRRWTANHVWIRHTGRQFYGTKIGLNTLFKPNTRPVKLFKNSWSWAPNSYRDGFSAPPPGYEIVGEHRFTLTGEGHLVLYEGERRRGQTPSTFGPSPQRLSPRVADSARNLQPTLVAWRQDGRLRVAVARNETNGVSWLAGLQSYTSTRVLILEWTAGRFRTVWESNRMTGYTSAIRRFGDRTWFSVVNPETSTTRLYQLGTRGGVPAR